MKKFLFLLIAAFAAIHLTAAPVDQDMAMRTAANFLSNELYAGKMMASSALNPVLLKAEMGSTKLGQPVYYIFNTSSTYLVISGDDRAREILMVGDQPLDLNHMPPALQYLLDCYKEQIEYLQNHPGLVVDKGYSNTTPAIKAATYGPLLTCNWDQTAPYYNDCVFTYNNTSYQCLTGCAATSASMVMYYWKYPTDPTPTVASYSFYLDDNYSRRITAPELPSTTFDWANMRDSYGWSGSTGTAAQKAAVAKLMRYVGQAERMGYGTQGSGIPSTEPSRVSNMFKLFGYDSSTTRVVQKSAYTQANWNLIIQNEMASGRPVVYLALSQNYGHAFNVDGYNGNSDLYHVNFGWSGYGNNWFAMNAFTDSDGETFNQYQQAIVGIQPPGGESTIPTLNVEPATLDFGTVGTGQTVTQTFHVTGQNLLTDVTFTRSGNASFSVSPASLTIAEVEAGADITVSYAPTAAANHTATIYVKSPGAPDVTVALTGTGFNQPMITSDPTELLFETVVGEPVTGVYTLKGYNLKGAVYLSVVNSTGGFSVNKSNVTKSSAQNGVEITVTYNPSDPGAHTALVMMRSTDADTIYVNLTGVASVIKYAPEMQPANQNYVTSNSFRADWVDRTYAGIVASYTLECTGNGSTVNVPGITAKNYVLENLTAGALYSYKVKTIYNDGTESEWSNVEQVTLLAPAFEPGDVDHSGSVDISDVTILIDYLLNNDSPIFTDTADVNGDGQINISDITELIDKLLSGN